MNEMAALLSPCQLGYGVSKGAEDAVHAVRSYITSLNLISVGCSLNLPLGMLSTQCAETKCFKALQPLIK